MKLAKNVRLGAWALIASNLLMAFGSIWFFVRMAPAIEQIIVRNEHSLDACENMLAALAMAESVDTDRGRLTDVFTDALARARGNITEKEEPPVLDSIAASYEAAFLGNGESRRRTVESIIRLGTVNRAAMVRADKRARQVGNAGAWGVVFMASSLFLVGMLFLRSLNRDLVKPFEEIHAVVSAFRRGDTMRRCGGTNLPKDIAAVFRDLNELLDRFGR